MRALERVPEIRPENLFLVLSRKFVSQLRMVGVSTDPDTHWKNYTKLFCGAMAKTKVLPDTVVLYHEPRSVVRAGGWRGFALAELKLQYQLHDPDLILVVDAVIMGGSPSGAQPYTIILRSLTDIDPEEEEKLSASAS